MENTACQKCAFVEAGLCATQKDCPNYCENVWQNSQGDVKIVQDCAPKRMLKEQIRLSKNMEILSHSVIELRNRQDKLEGSLKDLMDQSKKVLFELSAPLIDTRSLSYDSREV